MGKTILVAGDKTILTLLIDVRMHLFWQNVTLETNSVIYVICLGPEGIWAWLMEKAMAPHSSTLVWKISWMEEPDKLQSMESQRGGHDWATSLSLFTFMNWRRKWQPTPVFLPGESQGQGEPGGLPSMGLHRVGHDWSDLAAAACLLCVKC